MQSKTVHEIVPFRFRLLLSSNGRSGIKREHSEGELSSSDEDDDDNFHPPMAMMTIFITRTIWMIVEIFVIIYDE